MSQNIKDLQECVATMRDGSKSFFAASRILPQRVRDPATALYAFCRITDDVADAGCKEQRVSVVFVVFVVVVVVVIGELCAALHEPRQ
jgi:hypothetical protein